MSMTVRAAVAYGPNQPLRVETLTLDRPEAGEVLIEMKAAGLCHTDLTLIDGSRQWPDYPTVLGHEGAGIVLDVGPGVTSVEPGDHVIPGAIPECGDCPACRSRWTNLCDTYFKPRRRRPFSKDGHPVKAFVELGTFSTHLVARESQVSKIRSDAPLDVVCCMGCAGATGLGAVLFTARVESGTTVVVFGLGGIGCNVVDGARLAGATRIIGVDTNPSKEATARIAGLTDFVDPRQVDDIVGHMRDMTGGGADYAFECVGSETLWRQAVECTRIGWGTAVMVGIPPAASDPVGFRSRSILEGRRIMGSYIGNVKTRSQLPELVDWYVEGKLSLDQLITNRLTLDEINDGFAAMKSGAVLRSVVVF